MKISTLSIGDELVCGRIVDGNAATIAAALIRSGMRVQRHLVVGDSEPDIIDALAELGRTSDAVIVTGGLGPTVDDLTTRAVAHATGRRLMMNEEAREHLHRMMASFGVPPGTPLGEKQAMIPSKTTLIPNPTGTACGFQLMHNNCYLLFMPGVPSEMEVMLRESVIPFLVSRDSRKRSIASLELSVFGLGEPRVDEILAGLVQPGQGVQLGLCVSFPMIRVTLLAEADSDAQAKEKLSLVGREARERLGRFVFSEAGESLEEVVGASLQRQGMTLSLAESCTGGMIAQQITSVSGSSVYFLEGAVTYSNGAKSRRLGVPDELLREKGAVSGEVAEAMARGIRASSGSDLGVAVTGIAGPDGGTDEKPVGTVYISLASAEGCRTERFLFGGSRFQVRALTAWTALDWIRRHLLDHSPA